MFIFSFFLLQRVGQNHNLKIRMVTLSNITFIRVRNEEDNYKKKKG